jgi:hypothetical protein
MNWSLALLLLLLPLRALPSDALRLESEEKITVPQHLVPAVWEELVERYISERAPHLVASDPSITATTSDEFFIDRYYDDAAFTLLRKNFSVRQRTRIFLYESGHRKNGRMLLQVKAPSPTHEGTMTETKFTIDDAIAGSLHFYGPLVMLKKKDRAPFAELLASMGVRANDLQEKLLLKQRRRRIYVSDREGPCLTITMDEAVVEKLWRTVSFAEIEIEINEIRLTQASAVKAAQLKQLAQLARADVRARRPDLRTNSTPKYNKAHGLLVAGHPLFAWFYEKLALVGQ